MKIYGLTIPNLFAAIVVGLVLSFLLVSVLAPVDGVNHNEVKKDNQPVSQPTHQSGDISLNNPWDLAITLIKVMVLVLVASVVFALLSTITMRPY